MQLLSAPEATPDADTRGAEEAKGWAVRRFWPALVCVSLAGLAWRITYVLAVTCYQNRRLYDADWYDLQALTMRAATSSASPSNGGPTPLTRRSPRSPSPR